MTPITWPEVALVAVIFIGMPLGLIAIILAFGKVTTIEFAWETKARQVPEKAKDDDGTTLHGS